MDRPCITGSTAIAFKYKDGVIAGVDTASSYGSLAVENITRVYKITKKCILVFSGSIADIQSFYTMVEEEIESDKREIEPSGIHKFIQRILYYKRSRGEPLRLSVIICGVSEEKEKREGAYSQCNIGGKVLGIVNSKGNFWFESSVATGIASHLVLPILRERKTEEMNREEAIREMEDCMKLLVYKDCCASNKVRYAICEENYCEIQEEKRIETNWELGIKEGEIVLE